MTGVMSRHVVTIGALFLIGCGLLPKVGAVITTVPIEVLGGGVLLSLFVGLGAYRRLASAKAKFEHDHRVDVLQDDARAHLPDGLADDVVQLVDVRLEVVGAATLGQRDEVLREEMVARGARHLKHDGHQVKYLEEKLPNHLLVRAGNMEN